MPDLPHTVPQILDSLDYSGIDSALVYHLSAWEYDPETGNEFLMEELGGESRLRPQWVVLPHHTGEFAPPGELLDAMVSHGVLTARMFPSEKAMPPEEAGHNFSLASWSFACRNARAADAAVHSPISDQLGRGTRSLRELPSVAADTYRRSAAKLSRQPTSLAAVVDPREPVFRHFRESGNRAYRACRRKFRPRAATFRYRTASLCPRSVGHIGGQSRCQR